MPSKEAKGFHIFGNEAQRAAGLQSMLRSCQCWPASREVSPEVPFLGDGGPDERGRAAKTRLEAAP